MEKQKLWLNILFYFISVTEFKRFAKKNCVLWKESQASTEIVYNIKIKELSMENKNECLYSYYILILLCCCKIIHNTLFIFNLRRVLSNSTMHIYTRTIHRSILKVMLYIYLRKNKQKNEQFLFSHSKCNSCVYERDL